MSDEYGGTLPPGGSTVPAPGPDVYAYTDPAPFSEKDTYLGKFSHGCFDIACTPAAAKVQVTLRVRFDFDSDVSTADQASVRTNFGKAISNWDKSGVYLWAEDERAKHPKMEIRFNFTESKVCNKSVKVCNNPGDDYREWVGMWSVHISNQTSVTTLTHELGHVFGNYDEYDGGIENNAYWHDNAYIKQQCALMNGSGREFAPRYFDHIARWVTEHFQKAAVGGIEYNAKRDQAISCQ